MKSIRLFLHFCLEASSLFTAQLGRESAVVSRPVEKPSMEGNGGDVWSENKETPFCTTSWSEAHYPQRRSQYPCFSMKHARLLPVVRFSEAHKPSVDAPYHKYKRFPSSQFRRWKNDTNLRRPYDESILHHPIVLACNVL